MYFHMKHKYTVYPKSVCENHHKSKVRKTDGNIMKVCYLCLKNTDCLQIKIKSEVFPMLSTMS
jgi:hypothetical protein